MISIERFNEIVEEELKLLPDYVFEELNGGVVVDEKVNLHPKRLADDLYIMGTYSTSPVMGKQIVIYYGSFTKTMPYADEEALRLKIRDTLRHEFRHHMETRAGFFGKGTLIDEDKQEMDRYFLMHAERERSEAASSAAKQDAEEAAKASVPSEEQISYSLADDVTTLDGGDAESMDAGGVKDEPVLGAGFSAEKYVERST